MLQVSNSCADGGCQAINPATGRLLSTAPLKASKMFSSVKKKVFFFLIQKTMFFINKKQKYVFFKAFF